MFIRSITGKNCWQTISHPGPSRFKIYQALPSLHRTAVLLFNPL